jgi:hypothetical protein
MSGMVGPFRKAGNRLSTYDGVFGFIGLFRVFKGF